MEILRSDLKQAFRMLRQNPGFSATAMAVLALGIGANTAIFSVINAVLLKPLPFPNPERMVFLMNTSAQGSGPGASVPKYNTWRRQTQVLEDVSAYDTGGPGLNLSGGDRPEQIHGIHVSHEFFRLFGAQTVLGRTFTAEEDRPRGGNVVVISGGLWQRRFGSDPAIVGKNIAGRRAADDHRRTFAELRFRSARRSLSGLSGRSEQHQLWPLFSRRGAAKARRITGHRERSFATGGR